MATPVQDALTRKISAGIAAEHLDIVNESHMHSVPPNSETHFKVVVASDAFAGKRPVARHQMIYDLVREELAGPVHALALHTYTPEEWAQRSVAPASPNCLGGSKADH